jgi:hypothetical protein
VGADNGAYVKSPGGAGVPGAGQAHFLTPGVDGGRQKPYDGTVLRSGMLNRSCVRARVRLHGELRRVGCVRITSRIISSKGLCR